MYPDLITVIISAYGEFDYAMQAIKLRVDDYLLKPISPEKFKSVIQSICDQLNCRHQKKQLIEAFAGADLPGKKEILDELFGLAHSEKDPPETLSGVCKQVIQLIEKNYEDDINLEWLASQVFLTPGYLSGYFKQETGQNLIQYLTDYRMKVAWNLLLTTNMKISDVGKKVGYQNSSYFCSFSKNTLAVRRQMYEETAENSG